MTQDLDRTTLGVLRRLIDHGPLSRPELQRSTGLARATTSAVINDLLRRGIVAEISTPSEGRRGRPVALLDLDDTLFALAGVEIGFDRIMIALYTLRGRELLRVERSALADVVNPRALLRLAASALYEALDLLDKDRRRLLGVGVSVSGLVDSSSGTIKYAPSLGWRDVALSAGVEEVLGGRAPVLIDSTANFGALAERRHRLRSGHLDSSLVYLTGTYGISAGIVASRLWRGENGMAGEVGHLIVEPNGPLCVCGRKGCFDTKAGLSAIIAGATSAARTPQRARLNENAVSDSVNTVIALAQSEDPGVIEALEQSGRWLGQGAALVAAILDPRSIVLGGHYTQLAPWLLEPARAAFREALLLPDSESQQVEASALGAWAPAEGGALAVLYSYADGEHSFPADISSEG